MKKISIEDRWQRAVVIFDDSEVFWWIRFLKPKFRHCALLLCDGKNWLQIESLSCRISLKILALPASYDVVSWYKMSGKEAVEVSLPDNFTNDVMFSGIITCVSLVKRVLQIRKFAIITPWMLYKFLKKENNKKKILDKRIKIR